MLMVRRFVGGIISTTEEDIERMEKKKRKRDQLYAGNVFTRWDVLISCQPFVSDGRSDSSRFLLLCVLPFAVKFAPYVGNTGLGTNLTLKSYWSSRHGQIVVVYTALNMNRVSVVRNGGKSGRVSENGKWSRGENLA